MFLLTRIMKRGANAPYLVGALMADGIELGAAVAVGVDDGAYVSVVGA